MPLSPASRFVAAPGLILTDLESELILLDPVSQQMFSLNPVGRLIWQNLETCDLEQLTTLVVDRFAIDRETATRDATQLLEELISARLVSVRTNGR